MHCGLAVASLKPTHVPLGKLLDTLGASHRTRVRILKHSRERPGVYTARSLGCPLIAPVELAWDLVRGTKGVTRFTFDRAVAKVGTTALYPTAEEAVHTLPLVVIPPTKTARLATAYGASPQKAAALSWADIVFEKDGVPMADSRRVAEVFGVEHKNVLRDVRAIVERNPDRGQLNFEPSTYLNAQNKAQPCFHMTRDGFAFLAFGWTTPRADEFKWTFMDAFNAMETELRRRIEEDRIKALAEAKAALADAERGRKQAEDQRVGAQRAATAIRESMDKQANEIKELRAVAGETATHLCENSYFHQ